jgi:cytochrome c553
LSAQRAKTATALSIGFRRGFLTDPGTATALAFSCFVLLSITPVLMQSARAADGQEIAANGNSHGAPACSACHGEHGEGRPDAAYPRLAGLNSGYLIQQLNAFAGGGRDSEAMQPIATALTPDERKAIAEFYAGLATPKVEESNKADSKTIAIGAHLADRGDWSNGIPGCSRCHGPAGQGVGNAFPGLAGQSAEYITSQLKAWKEGKRTSDPLHLMTGIASKLSDDQVAAVAAYYASLPVAAAPTTTSQELKP